MTSKTKKEIKARNTSDPSVGEFITTETLANRLHVCPSTLVKWGHEGHLPFIKLDRKILWHWPSVKETLLRQSRNNVDRVGDSAAKGGAK